MKKSLYEGKTENNPHQIWKVTFILVKMTQIKAQLKPLFFISGQRKPETFVSGRHKQSILVLLVFKMMKK